jgi:lipopolysaccharide transport system permease protein
VTLRRETTSDPARSRPFIVIRPPSRWAPLHLRELWHFRDLMVRFVARDVTLRYRQTVLGVIWVILQPLLAAGAFSFVFGRVAGLSSGGVPYFAFAFVGMLAWNVFSASVTRMSTSLTSNSGLVSKIYFPRVILPLSVLGSVLLDFVVALGMFVVIFFVADLTATSSLLTLPLWLALVVMLATGIGVLSAALMVPYRDVQFIVPFGMSMLLYVSPVGYSLASVPASARTLYELNPLTGILEGFRWCMLGTGELNVFATMWAIGATLVVFVVGVIAFAHMERRFADVI